MGISGSVPGLESRGLVKQCSDILTNTREAIAAARDARSSGVFFFACFSFSKANLSLFGVSTSRRFNLGLFRSFEMVKVVFCLPSNNER